MIGLNFTLFLYKKTTPATPPIMQSITRFVPITWYNERPAINTNTGTTITKAVPEAILINIPLPRPVINKIIVFTISSNTIEGI